MYKEGEDYIFVPVQDSDLFGIKIIDGIYEDVIYCYGGVGVEQEVDNAKLMFDYIIIDPGTFTIDQLTSDEDFSTMIGDILVEIITVEGKNDSSGNNDTEESDSF